VSREDGPDSVGVTRQVGRALLPTLRAGQGIEGHWILQYDEPTRARPNDRSNDLRAEFRVSDSNRDTAENTRLGSRRWRVSGRVSARPSSG